MREERTQTLYHKGRACSWKTLLKHYPIQNKFNEDLFLNISHCYEIWGNDIPVLRNQYTADLFYKIASHSTEDVMSFYSLFNNTVAYNQNSDLPANHKYINKILLSIWFGKNLDLKKLSFFENMDEKDVHESVLMSFSQYGAEAFRNNKIEIDKLEEKILLQYIHQSKSTKLNEVLDIIAPEFSWDTSFVAENLKPRLFNDISLDHMDSHYLSMKNLYVLSERYHLDRDSTFISLAKESGQSTICFKEFYHLFKIFNICKDIARNIYKTQTLNGDLINKNKKYSTILEIFNDFPLTQDWSIKSFELNAQQFISESSSLNYQKYRDDFFKALDKIVLNHKMKEKIPSNNEKPLKSKI